jgi:hypothetical protein
VTIKMDLESDPLIRRGQNELASCQSVGKLSNSNLTDEAHLFYRCIERIKKDEEPENETPFSKGERHTIRWGGIALSVIGVPALFITDPIVGVLLTFGGLGLTGWGEWRGKRERNKAGARETLARPFRARHQAILTELKLRFDDSMPLA